MHKILILILLCVSITAEEVWVGIDYSEIDSKGKWISSYIAGSVTPDEIKRLRDAPNPESFITVENCMSIDSDANTYQMNGDGKYSKEESNTILLKTKTITSIVMLKGDPRKIFAKEGTESKLEKSSIP